ncbi:hypothetical protein [Actinomycetospora straminea]|uniref:hypothetical protein n=1 Tax=Actinomycetospora straminea TaxID=663607 RepID=UPI00236663D1|nr:hypothetical protein [Actinomycetospora straminea]MDD7933726.1 hypothetical protein [Actinomycetospora straminea]
MATANPETTLSGAPGKWAAGPVTESTCGGLTVGGKPVVWQASCTFTFTNSNTGATVLVVVDLAASTAAVRVGRQDVLVHGDSVAKQGNRLKVGGVMSGPLTANA